MRWKSQTLAWAQCRCTNFSETSSAPTISSIFMPMKNFIFTNLGFERVCRFQFAEHLADLQQLFILRHRRDLDA